MVDLNEQTIFKTSSDTTDAGRMEKQGEAKYCRLVVVVWPMEGHIKPILQLATLLYSRGFSITVLHPEYNSLDPSGHPDFTFMSVEDGVIEKNIPVRNFAAITRYLNQHCQEPFRKCFERIWDEERAPGGRIAGVIYNAFMYFAQGLADQFDVPGVACNFSAASIIAVSMLRRPGKDRGYMPLTDAEDLGPELQALKIKTFIPKTGFYAEELQWFMMNFTAAMQKSSAIVANTSRFLEQESISMIQKHFPALFLGVCPLHKLAPSASDSLFLEDRSCIPWLDKQSPRSVIYASFGSIVRIGVEQFLEVAWGLANSDQPFVLVIRPDFVTGSDSDTSNLFPESFHERVGGRGCIVQWALQKEVLKHGSIGGFLTHCGWNSAIESICEGVPMMRRPFGGDQPLNVSYLCDIWKIGIELEGEFEREKIAGDVRRLMVGSEGEEARRRAAEFKQKLELCMMKEGGSSFKSLNALVNLLFKQK